jgi:hypothetical protein
MRWTRGERSKNIEDRRFERGGRRGGGLKLGLGGILLLLVLSAVTGQDFLSLVGNNPTVSTESGGGGTGAPDARQTTAEEEELVDFISFVLKDVQGVWQKTLPARSGQRYPDAKLVLFRDAVQTACGIGQSASGPFYCPADQKVYIDLSFYDDLSRRFGAPGDFAQAYVLAHEIGHHVQNVLGIERRVRQTQRQRPSTANRLSVLMELQADCLAGVWAHTTARRDLLERGDLEEGLGAAAAVGDDRIQKRATGYVNPDSFTHGSAAQRVQWFRKGLETGDPDTCDTFGSGG